jgi:hypothetical protein
VYQGPRGSCLMKKTRGRKSRVRVPLRKLSITFFALISVYSTNHDELIFFILFRLFSWWFLPWNVLPRLLPLDFGNTRRHILGNLKWQSHDFEDLSTLFSEYFKDFFQIFWTSLCCSVTKILTSKVTNVVK